jgi:hypothetical protein
VHEVAPLEFGAKFDEAAHHVHGALPNRAIRARDRKPGRRHQQPVEAAHRDARILHGAAQCGALGRRHAIRILAERERRHFEPGIAELGGERALARELELAQHLVAEGKLHPGSGRP